MESICYLPTKRVIGQKQCMESICYLQTKRIIGQKQHQEQFLMMTMQLLVVQVLDNAKKVLISVTFEESHNTAIRSNDLCDISMHQVNFTMPFGALSGLLQLSFSLPSDVHSCKRITHNFLHELPPPVTTKKNDRRLPESSYGHKVIYVLQTTLEIGIQN
jgi:hypothetical protein